MHPNCPATASRLAIAIAPTHEVVEEHLLRLQGILYIFSSLDPPGCRAWSRLALFGSHQQIVIRASQASPRASPPLHLVGIQVLYVLTTTGRS